MTSYIHEDGDTRELPQSSAAEAAARLATNSTCQVYVAKKAFTFADLQEADMSIDVDFAAALPDGAVVIGAGLNVIAAFDNVGNTASVVADIGIKSGDRDAFVDGAVLDAVAKVGSPAGVGMGTLVGAITPSVLVVPDVNGNTLTKGSAVAYVVYTLAF
jgi:hypothetical protein